MPHRWIVEILINAKDNATQALGSFKKGFENALSIPTSFSDLAQRAGASLAGLIDKAGQFVSESVQMAIQAEALEKKFVAFAGGTQAAAEYLNAFTVATDGAVSKMDAMQGAGKLLQMGIVGNADEMQRMAAIASKLGDQTTTAGDRINDFALLLANQSVMRLDNFGISSGKVRQRIEELIKTGQAANREEAFKFAVMEEGAKSLEKLGSTAELTTTKIARAQAAIADVKLETGQTLLALAADINVFGLTLDNLPERLRGIPDALSQLNAMGKATQMAMLAMESGQNPIDTFNASMRKSAIAMTDFNTVSETLRYRQYDANAAIANTADAVDDLGEKVPPLDFATRKYLEELAYSEPILDDFQGGARGIAAALEETERASIQAANAMRLQLNEAMLDTTMRFKEYFDEVAAGEYEHASTIEGIEARHAEKLAEIKGAGNADLIAKENERYAEELRLAQESHAMQEEENRRTLGQMVLDSFMAWAQIKQIPADKMLEMRTAIAEEYGLIDAETANVVLNMTQSWESWSNGFGTSAQSVIAQTDAAIARFGSLRDALLNIPDKTVTLTVKLNNQAAAWAGSLGDQSTEAAAAMAGGAATGATSDVGYGGSLPGFQHGTGWARPGWAVVGERGPEMVNMRGGERVIPNQTTNNFTMNVHTRASTASVIQDFGVMRSMLAA